MSVERPFEKKNNIIGARDFGSPFATYAKLHFPRNMTEVFNWAEYMWLHQGAYSVAIQRAVRYFLNKIEITDTADFKIKRKYQDFLTNNLKILSKMAMLGDDYMAYGNSFSSIYRPFYRNLMCPACKTIRPVEQIDYKWADYEFGGECTNPKCKKTVTFKVHDVTDKTDNLRIIRWNPRNIEIGFNIISNDKLFYYDPDAGFKADVKAGKRLVVEKTPWEIIQCIKNDEKFEFAEDEIYHMCCETAASLQDEVNGWGLPPFLANFEYVMQYQVIKKYNEAIAMDMIVPFRFISPGAKGGGPHNDPLLTIDTGAFMRHIESMIKEHRKDPTAIHSVPYPVQYQAHGGEAKSLAPVELMQFALEELLSSMGIPQEFYKANLQSGGPPIGLRMFERSWGHFTTEMDNWLEWLMGHCSKKLMWEDVGAKLIHTSVLEDDLVRQTKLNLLGASKVSNQTALSAFNIDYEYEVDKVLEEQQMFDEKTQEMSRKQQKAGENQMMMDQPLPQPGMPMDPSMMGQGGGQPAPGGMAAPPPGAGGGMPMPGGGGPMGPNSGGSIDELHMQAEQIAQEILTMDPTTRKSQLIQLKHGDETLSALVKQKLQNLEQQAAQTGINMTRQGQLPPGGGMM